MRTGIAPTALPPPPKCRRAWARFRPADCGGFDEQARAVANAVVAEYVERDREYDRRTGHGLMQGARFP